MKKYLFLAILFVALALPSIAGAAAVSPTGGPAVNAIGQGNPMVSPSAGPGLMIARRCIRWQTRRRCERWGSGHRYCRSWRMSARQCLAYRAGRCVRWGPGGRVCRAWGYKGRRCLKWRVHRRCAAWR